MHYVQKSHFYSARTHSVDQKFHQITRTHVLTCCGNKYHDINILNGPTIGFIFFMENIIFLCPYFEVNDEGLLLFFVFDHFKLLFEKCIAT